MTRAAVLTTPGVIELQQRDTPRPAAGEALVEVLAVGVCGSDLHYFTEGRIGDFVVTAPLVLGHEASGRVIAVGADVRRLRPGDRVAIEPGVSCGGCGPCRTGRYNLCPDVRFLATPPVDGAFTEVLSVPEPFLHPIPDHVSDNAGALMEPLSVALWAHDKAQTGPGDHVLVTGAGPVGLLAATVARLRGAASVLVVDVVPERLDRAREHGFDATMPGRPPAARRATALIECSGSAAAVYDGLDALAPAGRAVLVGMPAERELRIPAAAVQGRELTITGTFRYAHTYPAAIGLVASGRIDLDRFVTAEFGLGDVQRALEAPRADPSILKAVVHPQRS
ncbi:NAD(P)-dependent alcohol dehydrogenase [Jiangella alba]|uniref:L-iditol 2-dehydrogenase n=1 Tax=Jiangella alba TaxID=561176 RepID=A0A1H5HJP2_9ACTN|nr:NAD(P)-dependent alcohol dehydrogenase [Jiangella alba]SEE27478.1 L-iditol 2-dehydrogenase [Jiangella alba]